MKASSRSNPPRLRRSSARASSTPRMIPERTHSNRNCKYQSATSGVASSFVRVARHSPGMRRNFSQGRLWQTAERLIIRTLDQQPNSK